MEYFSFVIMPFDKKFDDIYKLGIKEVAKECDVKAERLDEQIFHEGMLDRIYRQIDVSDFIIADLTDRNPNVFYELGYADAKGKACILLTDEASNIPFDLKHKRHIIYNGSISELKLELQKNIEWVLRNIAKEENNKLQIELNSQYGWLIKDKFEAKADIELKFDIHNKTGIVSPEITAIYLYTGLDWDVYIDSKKCPSGSSDIESFKYRYFINPPSNKIGKNGWSQFSLKLKRVLAEAYKGDVMQESYNLQGRVVMRIETSEGNIDTEFQLKVEIDDFPF